MVVFVFVLDEVTQISSAENETSQKSIFETDCPQGGKLAQSDCKSFPLLCDDTETHTQARTLKHTFTFRQILNLFPS